MYQYRAFGLNIYSSLRCDSFRPGGGPPDIVICEGSVPDCLPDAFKITSDGQLAPGRALVVRPGTVKCLVQEGRELIYECLPGADPAGVQVFLWSTPLGVLLHQRGMFPLHANAVVGARGCVLLVGDRGTGKTPTAAALLREGWSLLSDDICTVEFDGRGGIFVPPGMLRLKIRAGYADILDADVSKLPPVAGIRERKYWFQPTRVARFSEALRGIFVLDRRGDRATTRLPRANAISALRRYAYRAALIRPLGNEFAFLAFANALASLVPVYAVSRQSDDGLFSEVEALATSCAAA